MTLKTKAKIYRYFGIYLAQKEELAFVQSEQAKYNAKQLVLNNLDIDMSTALGIEIGMWQCEHGFTRPWSSFFAKRPYWFFNIIASLHSSLLALEYDITRRK